MINNTKEHVLHEIISCGFDGEEALFSSEIPWGEIIREYVEEHGILPSFDQILIEAVERFIETYCDGQLVFTTRFASIENGKAQLWGYFNGASNTQVLVSSDASDYLDDVELSDLLDDLRDYLGNCADVQVYEADSNCVSA